ncbi:MAG: adenylosuccinate lyase [Aureibaculum sp.]
MDRSTFIQLLVNNQEKLKYRDTLVDACLENNYVSILLDNMAKFDDEDSNYSARILELACKINLEIIIPYLDTYCDLLTKVKLNGVVRACSKICELMMISVFIKNNIYFDRSLKNVHFDKMVEAGFNWMITDQKIAVQAYTMRTLYFLGIKYDWIHHELVLIIEKNIPIGSTGYKNRGRKIIKAIKTNTPLRL